MPAIIFLYGGIFTVVPLAGLYAIAYKLFVGKTLEGFMSTTNTIKTAVAIALGIGVSYMIPARVFGWGKHTQTIDHSKRDS